MECARVFHRPTGIGPGDRVELVVPLIPEIVRVRLNEEAMAWTPGHAEIRVEVTRLLRDPNRLRIELLIPESARSPLEPEDHDHVAEEIRLEIHPSV